MRYQCILLPCKGTATRYHNSVAAENNNLWDLYELILRCHLNSDQDWEIHDIRNGKVISKDEFFDVILPKIHAKKFG